MRADPAVDHAMETGLAKVVGSERTPADVTFADFVAYLSRTPNRRLNEHWRPQSDFLIGTYTRMILFSHIPEDAAFLSRQGLSLAQARGHATTTIRDDLGPGWGYRKAGRLRRLRRRRGVLPTSTNMYDDTLRARIADRYADDVALLERVADEHH
jgi:hypothetical protein